MSENTQHAAEPDNARTVAIAPDAGELPTVPNVTADLEATILAATMKVDTPTEPPATQALTVEELPGTLLVPTQAVPPGADAPQEYQRLGPGVPATEERPSASGIDPATAAAWHATPPRKPRRAPQRGWLLPLAVLAGVIALLLWQHNGGRLSVSSVAASAATPSIGCDSTETVTATLRTDGDAGTIVYRWVRSDGTASDEIRQPVSNGTKQIEVVLRWAFSGHGSVHALATIDVDSPGAASAVAAFTYTCP